MAEPTLVRAHQINAEGVLGIVIPKPIREKLGITKGSRLLAYEDSGKLVFRRIETLKGFAEDAD